jgi:predicted peptidase
MKPNRLLFLAILFSTGIFSLYPQTNMKPIHRQTHHLFVSSTDPDAQLKYLLYLPNGYEKEERKLWPVLLFLHGAGERGDSLDLVKMHGPPKIVETKDLPFIVVSPQCPVIQRWSPAILKELLDDILLTYRTDEERIYLTGLSMGGFGTWDLSMEYPEMFAALAPICGGGDPSRVERIQHIPTWVFHGAKDPVVSLERSEEMVNALKKINSNVKFTVYPEATHDSWTETYNNEKLYEWFLEQKK